MNVKRLERHLKQSQADKEGKEYGAILEQLHTVNKSRTGWAKLSRSFPRVRWCIFIGVGILYYVLFGLIVSLLMVITVWVALLILERDIDCMAGFSDEVIEEYNNCRKEHIHVRCRNCRVKKEKKPVDYKRLVQNIIFIITVLSVVILIILN